MLFGTIFQLTDRPPKNAGVIVGLVILLVFVLFLMCYLIVKVFFSGFFRTMNSKILLKRKVYTKKTIDDLRLDDNFAHVFNVHYMTIIKRNALIYPECVYKRRKFDYKNIDDAMRNIGYENFGHDTTCLAPKEDIKDAKSNTKSNRAPDEEFYLLETAKDNSCGFHAFFICFFPVLKKNDDSRKLFFDTKIFKNVINSQIYKLWHKNAYKIVKNRTTYFECTQKEMYELIFYLRLKISSIIFKNKTFFIFEEEKNTYKTIFSYIFNTDEWMDQTCMMALSKYFCIKIGFINVNVGTQEPFGAVFENGKDVNETQMNLILSDNHWEVLCESKK